MYYFSYARTALAPQQNPVFRNLTLVSELAWVKGQLYDTGAGFPAMTTVGESKVIGKLFEINEDDLSALATLARQFDEINEPYRFVLTPVTAHTSSSSVPALTFAYDDTAGLAPIAEGIWR